MKSIFTRLKFCSFSRYASTTACLSYIKVVLGKEIGPMALYFGCRHPEHDYIYEEELKKYVQDGVLSELHIAFSRISANKVSFSCFFFLVG